MCCGRTLKVVPEQRAQEVTDAAKDMSESQSSEDSTEEGGNKFTVSGLLIHAGENRLCNCSSTAIHCNALYKTHLLLFGVTLL